MNRTDSPMPGCWICDKCGFILQKNVIHTGDGTISANTSPLNERCPNDNVLMRPYTWREANEGFAKSNDKLRQELFNLLDQIKILMDGAANQIDCDEDGQGVCHCCGMGLEGHMMNGHLDSCLAKAILSITLPLENKP